MKILKNTFLLESKLFLREPLAVFFTIFYSPLLLFIFGSIYGNKPTPFFGGLGAIDVFIPSFSSLIILSTSLMGMPSEIVFYRQTEIFKRLKVTPLKSWHLASAYLLTYLLTTLTGLIVLLIYGFLVYQVKIQGSVLLFLAGYIYATFCFLCFGFLFAALFRTTRQAQVIPMVISFPMMFLSGATIPLEMLPKHIRQLAEFLPLTHVVKLLRKLWIVTPLSSLAVEILILGIIASFSLLFSLKKFRWQ